MSEERILSILREAGASEEEIRQARRAIELWKRGELSSEDVYLFIMGLAREKLIPLTPRQVGELRRILGIG